MVLMLLLSCCCCTAEAGLSPTVPDGPASLPGTASSRTATGCCSSTGGRSSSSRAAPCGRCCRRCSRCSTGRGRRAELGEELGAPAQPAVEQALDLLAENGCSSRAPRRRRRETAIAAAYGIAPSWRRSGFAPPGRRRRRRPCGAEVARLLRRAGAGEVTQLEWRLRRPSTSRWSRPLPEMRSGSRRGTSPRWRPGRAGCSCDRSTGPWPRSGRSSSPASRRATHASFFGSRATSNMPPTSGGSRRRRSGPPAGSRSKRLSPASLPNSSRLGRRPRHPSSRRPARARGRPAARAHDARRAAGPRCPACSTAERLAPPVPLARGRGRMIAALSPRLRRAVSPYTGIVGGSRSACTALRSAALPGGVRSHRGEGLLGASLGHLSGRRHGTSRAEAASAAVGEALERYSATYVPA